MQIKAFHIFCDGACSGNPGPGGWGTIIVTPEDEVTELGQRVVPTTNNQMEISAAIAGLRELGTKSSDPIYIYTDSSYLIQGITQWLPQWIRRGWKTSTGSEVLNQSLWIQLNNVVVSLGTSRIHWQHVPGHKGVVGNERADEISVAFANDQPISLYRGPFSQYGLELFPVVPREKAKKSKGKGSYYLSWVNNVLEKHGTWSECEARVMGISNAKFKKISSPDDEKLALKQWGIFRGD